MSTPHSFSSHRRGAALLIVLAILALVLVLAVGFLTRVSTERVISSGYASSINARLTADTAVNLVKAQITSATTQGTSVAWSSQPGLIRLFNDHGEALQCYKLYSSDQMRVDGALDPAAEEAGLAEWFNHADIFTDLNAPVDQNFDGVPDLWPIADPGAAASTEGFTIGSSAPLGKDHGVTNPLPMPVRWLYVLRDGRLVAPEAGSPLVITGATADNPVVGRIAFWTDDETCKVNLNTSSEGSYWDLPRAITDQEQNLGKYQPAHNEFQAYPGHPATTSLSAVFPTLSRSDILNLVPRYQDGGSKGGTAVSAGEITADQDRLIPSVDEIILDSNRLTHPGLTKEKIQQAKFCLTVTSRAPETNLFNLPRIACWPISAFNDNDHRTAYDRLIAFCASLKSQPFYFQRKDAGNLSADYSEVPRNRTLYSYLQTLTSRNWPGFGGNLATKFGNDRDQILTEIFDYIRCTNLYDYNLSGLTGQYARGIPEPGNSDERFAPGNGQVLPIEIGSTRGCGRFPTVTETGIWFICTGDPTVAESNDPVSNGTLFPADSTGALVNDTVAKTKQIRIEAAFLMEMFTPLQGWIGLHPDVEIVVSGLEKWKVRGDADSSDIPLLFPSVPDQTEGAAGRYRFQSIPFYTGGRNWGGHIGIRWPLANHGIRARNHGRLKEDADFSYLSKIDAKDRQYPFVGEPVTVKISTRTKKVQFLGGPITIELYDRASGVRVQTLAISFQPCSFNAPKLVQTTTDSRDWWTFQADGAFAGNVGRFTTVSSTSKNPIRDDDVIQSMVPARSGQTMDYRLLAMRSKVPEGDWVPHPRTGKDMANSFTEPVVSMGGNKGQIQTGAKLANIGVDYSPATDSNRPDLPLPATSAVQNGDWENGMAKDLDGPYMNKPDEGNTNNIDKSAIPYFSDDWEQKFSTTFSSPNRIMPSPGMFGSLPIGTMRGVDWQTLLFRRQPGHPAYPVAAGLFSKDPDYLLLDLFWMPIVEPYALSEPLSTAGKINMNQQIIPFGYIQRDTALHALLKNEKMMSIPASEFEEYKDWGKPSKAEYRRPLQLPPIVKQFRDRYSNADSSGLYAFRCAAEICDIHLIPDDAVVKADATKKDLDQIMQDYWTNPTTGHGLTGDSSRERIYTTLYPRLTTKSNVFTVHYRAQALKQISPRSRWDVWDERKDVVQAEFRGFTTIERYIDPNRAVSDYATDPDRKPALDAEYHWKVRAHKHFNY